MPNNDDDNDVKLNVITSPQSNTDLQ